MGRFVATMLHGPMRIVEVYLPFCRLYGGAVGRIAALAEGNAVAIVFVYECC